MSDDVDMSIRTIVTKLISRRKDEGLSFESPKVVRTKAVEPISKVPDPDSSSPRSRRIIPAVTPFLPSESLTPKRLLTAVIKELKGTPGTGPGRLRRNRKININTPSMSTCKKKESLLPLLNIETEKLDEFDESEGSIARGDVPVATLAKRPRKPIPVKELAYQVEELLIKQDNLRSPDRDKIKRAETSTRRSKRKFRISDFSKNIENFKKSERRGKGDLSVDGSSTSLESLESSKAKRTKHFPSVNSPLELSGSTTRKSPKTSQQSLKSAFSTSEETDESLNSSDTAPKKLAGTPKKLTRIPKKLARKPKKLAGTAKEPVGTFKKSVGTPKKAIRTPKKTAGTPKETARLPKKTDRRSKKTAETPKETGRTPKETGRMPKETGRKPRETAEMPWETARTPKKTSRTPKKIARTPWESAGSPKKSAETPKKSAEKPNKSADTPNKTAKTPSKSPETPKKSARTPTRSTGTCENVGIFENIIQTRSKMSRISIQTPEMAKEPTGILVKYDKTSHKSVGTPQESVRTPHESSGTPMKSSRIPPKKSSRIPPKKSETSDEPRKQNNIPPVIEIPSKLSGTPIETSLNPKAITGTPKVIGSSKKTKRTKQDNVSVTPRSSKRVLSSAKSTLKKSSQPDSSKKQPSFSGAQRITRQKEISKNSPLKRTPSRESSPKISVFFDPPSPDFNEQEDLSSAINAAVELSNESPNKSSHISNHSVGEHSEIQELLNRNPSTKQKILPMSRISVSKIDTIEPSDEEVESENVQLSSFRRVVSLVNLQTDEYKSSRVPASNNESNSPQPRDSVEENNFDEKDVSLGRQAAQPKDSEESGSEAESDDEFGDISENKDSDETNSDPSDSEKIPTQNRQKQVTRPRVKTDPMKKFAENRFYFHTKMPIETDCMDIMLDGASLFFDEMIKYLECFAEHAGRKKITSKDIRLFMWRQGFVTETHSYESLVMKYMPYEYQRKMLPLPEIHKRK